MVTSTVKLIGQIPGICGLFGGTCGNPPTLSGAPHALGVWAGTIACRSTDAAREGVDMPDLAALLLRRSIGSLGPSRDCCSECRRTPLIGERLYELDSGRMLCELCFVALPEERRTSVRSERVHVSERRLAVVPKAA
jgi:hypothetical protein